MIAKPSRSCRCGRRARRGVALVAVIYFMVLTALTSVAVVFGTRVALRRTGELRGDAAVVAAGDALLYGALAGWDGEARARQAIGSTEQLRVPPLRLLTASLWVTRLGLRLFSLVVLVREVGTGASRRSSLLVRVPIPATVVHSALVSAVDVRIGADVRFTADSAPCGADLTSAITVSPGVALAIDPLLPADERPSVRADSIALDSAAYLRVADAWWVELAQRADIRLAPDAHVAPMPIAAGGTCRADDGNWGEPSDSASPCHPRMPLVYAPGDLTIEGGRGQGVLLVDGRLLITGPFQFSGQIVARRGIETRADAITISGGISVWRAASDSARSIASVSDVVLTHATTIRYSRCDAAHGVASWLQPRVVHARAWTELF